jgi:hypothetical protein
MISPEELGLKVKSYAGDEVIVWCPYHDDHNPSATFNTATGLFYCFSCGTGKQAKEIARDLGGIITDQPIRKTVHEEPGIDWRTRFMFAPKAFNNEYLKNRQVPWIAIDKLQIREVEEGIVFPLFSDATGTVSGVQVRRYSMEPKYVFYGDRPAVYPLTGFPVEGPVYLVEGIFSVIRGRRAGFNVFAVMGAQSLVGALKYFYDRSKVFAILDPDEAGYIASAKLASIGISCCKIPFEADEMSVKDWRVLISNPANFTMDAGYFGAKAVSSGGKTKSIMQQILKFEKENK